MKLLKLPQTTVDHIELSLSGISQVIPGRRTYNDVEIFLPMENNAKDKVWNKLKYGCTGVLRIGERVERIVFEKEGCILHGVIPYMESMDVQDSDTLGSTFKCKIDYYEVV